MTLTRRRFLTSTATVAVAAAAGIAGKSEAAAAATAHHPLRRSTFTPLVGRTMTAAHGGRQTRVRLRRIRDVFGAPAGSEQSFILEFSARRHLPDGIYRISHRGSGRHALFMSGVLAAPHRRYEVVVNRSTS